MAKKLAKKSANKSKKTSRARPKFLAAGNRRVTPIPPSFSTVTPYLTVTGAAEAIEFYKKAFGAKELGRSNAPDGKVMNATIRIGDSNLMLADEFPRAHAKSPSTLGGSSVTIHLYSRDVDKLWAQAVAAGAKVAMALENQFWGERYGQLTDPFGHQWSLSMQVKMSPKELEERQRAAMKMFAAGSSPSDEQTVSATNTA